MKTHHCIPLALLAIALAMTTGCEAGAAGESGAAGGLGAESVDTCAHLEPWPEDLALIEAEVVAEVNIRRSQTADCNTMGTFESTGPLAMNAQLQCAARLHTVDMLERNFFDHVNPDGEEPWDRITETGYSWGTAGENIAAGQQTAQEVVAGWMSSDGHCANIMDPNFTEIGVGLVKGGSFGTLWTQVFASPL